ncbi:TonB-dependent receptor [Sunxiuqinia elliptica]
MKKNRGLYACGLILRHPQKIVLKMKFTILFIMLGLVQSFALDAYAQSARFSLDLHNAKVVDALLRIEDQSDYYFVYNKEAIDLDRTVQVDVKNRSIEEVLDLLFENTNVNYQISERHIILSTLQLTQDNRTVTGKVTDPTGGPLPGVTVAIKGTTQGTITDIDGRFELSGVTSEATLVFSFVGMRSQEIVVGSQTAFNIVLEEETIGMDEVVVVGYGTQRKESLTGSMQTVNSEKLKDVTTPSVENMLSGKAPGVYVAPGSGQPGAAGAIIIRGKSTVNGSNDPLWVIDGVIVGSDAGALNPSDVETITILKDAASTAIYGSQGANGVIVVTTNKAKADKMTIKASAKLALTSLDRGNLEVMNGAELYDYYKSFGNVDEISFPRWNDDLRNSNFDWWDLASQTGIAQDYNVSIAGGKEKVKSYLSVGVYDEEGAVKGYDYKRYNFRYKTDFEFTPWLNIRPSVAGSKRDISNQQHAVSAMYSNLPWDSAYDEEGNIVENYSSSWVNSNSTNYLHDLQWNRSESTTYEFMGNLDFDVKLTDWLTFSSVNNFKWRGYSSNSYTDPRSSAGEGVNGRLEEYQSNLTRRYTNQLLRINKVWENHSLNAMVAYEFNDYRHKEIKAIGTGFVPGFEVLDVTAKPEATEGKINEWAVQSTFLNAHYGYDGRYYAQLSLRRDGASNFGDNAKYGNFFSISGGWSINREQWFNSDWVDVLKLRLSYGSVGNRPNSLYPQYDLYSVSQSYNEVPGALISQIGNKDLTWEKTYTTGIGLDLAFFKRLRMTVDLYDKNTSNLLYAVPVSGLTGVTRLWRNVGELNNKGFEVTMGVDIIKTKDLFWSFDANLGLNRNKIEKLYGDRAEIIVGDGSGIAGGANKLWKPGVDSDTWYVREWAGVDPENGDALWYTTAEDGSRVTTNEYDKADLVKAGAYTPDFFGGFSTQLNYKDFDFSAVFGYSVGGKIYNYTRAEYDSDGAYTDRNQMRLMDDWSRWEKPGDIATHPLPSYNNSSNSNKASSRYLEDGDYLKLRNVTLGYNLALPEYYISNLRLFVSGENLFTLTNYSGVDPEIPPKEGKVTGVTTTVYPSTRKFIFGVNLTF